MKNFFLYSFRLIAFVQAILLPISAYAYDFMVGGLCYSINNDGASVSVANSNGADYSNSYPLLTEVTVPNSVYYGGKTYKVTSIGSSAFYNCTTLKSISLPNTIITIEKDAFAHCASLSSINLPNSVIGIMHAAFEATGLTKFEMPNSVKSLGDWVFTSCGELQYLSLSSSLTNIPYNAFSRCPRLETVVIPPSVASIASYAFSEDTSLKNVIISDVAAWCNIIFDNWDSNPVYFSHRISLGENEIENLVVPATVQRVRKYAFYYCESLKTVDVSEGTTFIEDYAFSSCRNLEIVTLPRSISGLGAYAFNASYGLTEMHCRHETPFDISSNAIYTTKATLFVPKNCTEAYKNADVWKTFKYILEEGDPIPGTTFFDANGLAYIVNEDHSTASVCRGDYQSLTMVSIPSYVTYGGKRLPVTGISERAFSGYSGLASVYIPNSVTTIGREVFYNCVGLTSIDIPNSVTDINDGAFSGCKGLTSVNIGNSVTTIGNSAFNKCSALTRIDIPESTVTIGEYAFYGCSGLNSITIPRGVASILRYALYNVNAVTITGDIENVGVNAFYNAKILNLTGDVSSIKGLGVSPDQIYCYGFTPPVCDDKTFGNYNATLHVPQSALTTYFNAPYWSKFSNIKNDALEPTSVTLSQSNLSLIVNETFQLKAIFSPSGATAACCWQSTDENIVEVSSSGYVTARSSGEADIIVYAYGMQAVCHVRVSMPQIYISLNKSEITLREGEIADIYATTSPIEVDVTASSDNEEVAIARVNGNKIQILALNIGTATITVAPAGEDGASAQCKVTVVFYDFMEGGLAYNILDGGADVQVVRDGSYKEIIDLYIPSTVSHNGKAYRVMEISQNAFIECDKLKTVTMENAVSDEFPFVVEENAFADCSSIEKLKLPSSLAYVHSGAFERLYSLRSLRIPNSVKDIDEDAFCDNRSLKWLAIGSGVAFIGETAFGNCYKLDDVYLYVGDPNKISISYDAFSGPVLKYINLHVRPNTLSRFRNADVWKEFNIVDDLGSHDVNGDASVNVGDVNTVLGAILANDDNPRYDVNLDGQVNVGDVNAILATILAQ